MGEAEGRKEAHEGGRAGGNPPGGLHGGPAGVGRGVEPPLRDRALNALFLFVPLAAWPAAGAAVAWRAGDDGAFALALGAAAVSALPALFTLLGFSWARKAAEGFALAGMILGVLFVLRNGLSLLAVPAVGYFVVYAFLSHERFRAADAGAAKSAEPPPPEHPLAWLKENVEAIAVAFIMALVIRCFCVEVFKIPSSSMEPTLLGDTRERGGDRIMVTKLTYGLQDVARFEPVVFKFPLNPMKNYIKRVVGLPDEFFMLFRGNVYTSPSKDGPFRIQRKPLRIQRSLWIKSFRDPSPPLDSETAFEAAFPRQSSASPRDGVLTAGGTGSVAWTARPIDDGHLGASHGSLARVGDLLFEGDLTLPSGSGQFWVRIEHELGAFKLHLRPSGGSELTHAENSHPLKTPSFPSGRAVRVEFMIYDGQAFVLFDGRVQVELAFQETMEDVRSLAERTGLSFGADGTKFSLASLRIAQDIHYKPKENEGLLTAPVYIEPGKYFMLGDNVNNSHDGRAWRKFTHVMMDGTTIEFEGQARVQAPEALMAWARRNGRDHPPDQLIEADIHGHERAVYFAELRDRDDHGNEFMFVEGRFIIGRAFAVCWPLSRSLKLIR